ncbi:ABC1 family protein YLR253W [Rhizoctonia solani AG-1 IB]|uniref:ABC1 family protein YLR253W n=1 Tax=Thanatephorus cucumeris (strain AG1-IB / isolate 7/3/14) TaxID=1108050 RepID=M5BJN8_THACB|nr:ABC1 family protein YLR253W [Rhizoctonia solani AG-1 IB]
MRIPALRRLALSRPVPQPRGLRYQLYATRLSPSNSGSQRERLWNSPEFRNRPVVRRSVYTLGSVFFLASSGYIIYKAHEPSRHFCLAVVRCSRVAKAVIEGVVDYKILLSRSIPDDAKRTQAYSSCHKRSAERVLHALQLNGGIYIKLDQCYPTPIEDVKKLFLQDTGISLEDQFSEFDETPIGVASLAQVHIARDRVTGQQVAVKLQHPGLEDFAEIDITTATISLAFVKRFFPTFEFSWLGEELATNLPLEMNFVHEAENTARVTANFAKIPKGKTSVYVPKVLRATPRTLVMEYVKGGRVDDLEYLAKHNIDRNLVSQELSRAFSEMVYIHGFFHADPHPGNLLIRPAPPGSRIACKQDHGLYFDLDDDLRLNYARLWLALIAPGTPAVARARRKYAEAMNITSDLYPIFESAITGRAGLEGTWDTPADDGQLSYHHERGEDQDQLPAKPKFKRARGLIDAGSQSQAEISAIRKVVLEREGLVEAVFDLLRRVPRRVLMILKLNDLTRNLDQALVTTHSEARVFVIMARYCSRAVWEDARKHLGYSFELFNHWLAYIVVNKGLRVVEWYMDTRGRIVTNLVWARGLVRHGRRAAFRAAAGLAPEA